MNIVQIIHSLAKDIFTKLGPGHSEAVYGKALAVGLQMQQISYENEKTVPILYENRQVGTCRLDLVVSNLVIELKCVNSITPQHRLQLNRYLLMLGIQKGMVLNFSPGGVEMIHLEKDF